MKNTITSILIALVLIGGAFILTRGRSPESEKENVIPANNVSIVDGVQIIEIKAKGGYQPRRSTAKAGTPTILRFDSKGTFDCSASVRIPKMDISRSLDFSGSTEIDLGVQPAGTLKGTCSMGMYPFEIEFKD